MALEVHIETQLPEFSLEVNFTADARPVGILGASGAGKSMTLRCIAGIETPTRGRITLNGRALFDSSRGVRLPSRVRQVGLVFQNYALFPHLTVEENVVFGLRRLPAAERASQAAEQIAAAHVTGLEGRYPGTLSGGEQQRVALARALATRPAALLLDEPFSALDTYLRSALERQLRETLAGYHGAVLLVSHNLEEIYRLCGELVVLDRGRMIAHGGRDEIFRRPPGRRVAELTGCKNFSRARASGAHSIEAIDWGCSLRTTEAVPPELAHCGIRAHHVEVSAADSDGPTGHGLTGHGPTGGGPPGRENTFRGWVADSNEGPFSMTLYIRLNQPPRDPSDYHLQVEIPRERWIPMNAASGPYLVRLDPQQVILLAA